MMKPLLSNEFSMSFGSRFNTLTSRDGVQTVGSAARPWTNVAAFARLSAMVNGSGRLANAVDSLTVGGIPFVSSMNGAENLVSTDLTDWDSFNATPSDLGGYEYQAAFSGDPNGQIFYSITGEAPGDEYTFSFKAKLSTAAFDGQFLFFDDIFNSLSSISFATLTDDYQCFHLTCTVGANGLIGPFLFSDEEGSIKMKNIRCVKSAIPHAAPPVGSIVNYTYATDQLSQASVVYTGDDFIVIAFMPYGWSGVNNPSTATPIIFEAGALQITLASGFYATNGGAVSTKKPVADTLSVMYLHFDGANHTISVDNETPVVNASAIVPTGTTYGGNLAAGTEPAHAILVPFVGPGSESATNITLWNTELQSRLGGIVTQ